MGRIWVSSSGTGCSRAPVPGAGRAGPGVTLPSGTHPLLYALSPLADFDGLQMFSLQPGQRERTGSVAIGSAVNHCDGFLRRASSQGHKHLASGQRDIRGAPRPSPRPARGSAALSHPASTQQLITFPPCLFFQELGRSSNSKAQKGLQPRV